MVTPEATGQLQPLRKLIHLGGALFPLLYLFVSRQMIIAVSVVSLTAVVAIEWARQHWPFLQRLFEGLIGPALRAGEEQRPTTGLWSMLGILGTVLLFARELAIPAMFYAQVGDPAAELVGRRWGRHRLPNGKSWEGSLGCFSVSLVIGLVCSQILSLSVGVAAVGALVATVAEALPLPVGDNLVMAPLSGLAMAVLRAITPL
jgi:dolichol kinase